MLMFFITFCVIGLITGWALEGSMTVLEEIDTKTEMPVPSLALCPQPWGGTFAGDMSVKDAHIFSIPGGKEGPKVKWRTVTCPTGATNSEAYYGLEGVEDYNVDDLDYTGYQTGKAQGEGKVKDPAGGSRANGTQSLLDKSHSTAPAAAPLPRSGAAPAPHQAVGASGVASGTGAGAERKAGKPPLSHHRWGQGVAAPPYAEGGVLRSLMQKSKQGTQGISLLQDDAVGRSGAHSHAGGLLANCFCVNLEQNILTFRGERGNVQDLDYVSVTLGNLKNSNPSTKQFAFGFYLDGMLPQQWSYGDAGQVLEGDLRSEEVATGKTEFSDGTSVPRFAFRKSGASESADGVTTLVFGYDKYLSYVIASFASKFSFFAMMTLIITCCAAINNFGLFEIVFPERSDDGPPELEPNVFLRSIAGYCCYCCTLTPEAQKKDEEAA
jgi:hypothetical protein